MQKTPNFKNSIMFTIKINIHLHYKTDKWVIRHMIRNNMKCTNNKHQLHLIIYYKSPTVTSLITKNNTAPRPPPLKQTNVIYEYTCNRGECEPRNRSYIGMTTTTLSRRLTMHLVSGGPKTHAMDNHNTRLTREELAQDTKILRHEPDFNRL